MSVTNGDAGHQTQGGGALAARRRAEAQEAGRRVGVDYIVLDNHDGELMPDLKVREQIIRLIREWKADLVLGPRANDYHPDHRYTGILLQDAAFMVTVPNIAPDTPALRENPVFMYFEDGFQKPAPFTPDVAVSIDDTVAKKIDMIDAHVSQFYEWLPWLAGRLDQVPKDAAARRAVARDAAPGAHQPGRPRGAREVLRPRRRREGAARRGVRDLRVRPPARCRGNPAAVPVPAAVAAAPTGLPMPDPSQPPALIRRFGLLQATALNMSNMIGIGPFITIPLLMSALGGPQALVGWVVALVIVVADGLVWSELGAAMPGSGGSYQYLREGFGRERWGRLVAFLFIWQFILSGPLEIASGYIGFARYLRYVWPGLPAGRHHRGRDGGGRREHRAALPADRVDREADRQPLDRHAAHHGRRHRRPALMHFDPARGLRRPGRRVLVLDRVPARSRRGVARRHLRLPRVLQRRLHRRRGEGPRPRHPAVDPDQRRGRRA